jgi:hypothetical protein
MMVLACGEGKRRNQSTVKIEFVTGSGNGSANFKNKCSDRVEHLR